MKKKYVILLITNVLLLCVFISKMNPSLKGFYQSDMIGDHVVQMLMRHQDNTFAQWIDNREVDSGTYKLVHRRPEAAPKIYRYREALQWT